MKILMGLSLLALSGCAASPDYNTYVRAQSDANAAHVQKPLLVLEAHDGQPITGLARVEVNMPTQAPVIQQARPNEWAAVVSQGLGILGAVGGVVATGKAMEGVANAVIGGQAPMTPNITTTNTTNTTTTTTSTDSSINGSYNPSTPTTITNSYNPNNAVTTYPVAP